MIRMFTAGAVASAFWAAAAFADETRTFDLPDFDGIDVATGLSVEYEYGAVQSVEAKLERGDWDDVTIKVEDGELIVKRARSFNWGARGPKLTVYVTGPELSSIDASSGASFAGKGLRAGDLDIGVSSGASVVVSGDCNRIAVDASSGSSVSARDLKCASAMVDASSGSSISVYASESASADGSSGASVSVHGSPSDVDKDTSSGASVSVKG